MTNYYNKQEVDTAISNASLGGGGTVDLSAYATNASVDYKISTISLTPGPEEQLVLLEQMVSQHIKFG
jgi:hypothetical protein